MRCKSCGRQFFASQDCPYCKENFWAQQRHWNEMERLEEKKIKLMKRSMSYRGELPPARMHWLYFFTLGWILGLYAVIFKIVTLGILFSWKTQKLT